MEKGLRFLVVVSGGGPGNLQWDAHDDIEENHKRKAAETDKPVAGLLKDLERRGCTVDGQIAATRSAGRTIAKVARARQVRYVVMDLPTATGVRKIIEGEITGIVRRRLRDRATLELVGGKS